MKFSIEEIQNWLKEPNNEYLNHVAKNWCTEENILAANPQSKEGKALSHDEYFEINTDNSPVREIGSHLCPYKMEINNDFDTMCDCDVDQTHECAMDV